MIALAYLAFVFAGVVFGAAAGFAGHFLRAHATFLPEDLDLGEPWDTLTRDNYQFEKHAIGAKWDDNGYWDSESNRNLAYYVISGAAMPLVFGAIFWGQRALIVDAVCGALKNGGLHSPLCLADPATTAFGLAHLTAAF